MADDPTILQRLAEAIGLPPDTDAETLLAKVVEMLAAGGAPDPKKFAPVEALQELLRDRNSRLASMGQTAAAARVEDALRRGYITPAMRGWATALCAAKTPKASTPSCKAPRRPTRIFTAGSFPPARRREPKPPHRS